MADVKISGLPASTTPLAGTEVLPIVQGGVTKQVSVNNLTAGKDIAGLGLTLTSTDSGASQAPTVDLYRDSATPAAADTIGEVEFNGRDSAANKQAYALFHGSILSPTSGAEQGQLHFETATAGALTEKMIIGTTNLVINEPGNVFNVRIEGDTDANLFYTDATNSRVGIGTITPAQKLDVAGSINLTGNVIVANGQGVDFSATPGTGTSELFNDYEIGVWTPIPRFGGANVGMTYTSSGIYTKVGNLVTVIGDVSISVNGSSTGTFTLEGLPFAAATGNAGVGAIFGDGFNFTGAQLAVAVFSGASVITGINQTGGAGVAGGYAFLTQANINAGGKFFSVTYRAA